MTVAEEWIERGKEQGREEERQEILLHLIERKFGTEAKDAYYQRVLNASLDDLEGWIDRLLDAESVESVFGEE